ncbi:MULTISPECIES: primary-amine oxidase [Microbacterium]|jgi:primary-amine oxidase|uniref:primary-amine oxidase n=1 Tax=Microbacterium TaxID=33882 RepID=UPI0023DBD076|nr:MULTISPECIES: primary-amine oxidase [Microbacterium]MDF2046576.1 primary-amine oxidase [Microbacterium sp. Kw_RZR3]MDF2916302.1 tyramine oxidase [Microbacterium sp.]MDQ1074930.1 primary-amine oxidase [Microbacterium sp. SORGH_AS_0969]MDQ1115156.1 primary-amine oxidase [Microbacterium testaceum]
MTHPLDRLSAAEIEINRSVLLDTGFDHEATAFMLVNLIEPDKAAVLDGTVCERLVGSVLMDRRDGTVTEVVVDVTAGRIVSRRTVDVVTEGQPPIVLEEFDRIEELLRRHDGWVAAMARREIDDVSLVRISALSAGRFGFADEDGRRIVRCLSFLQLEQDDNAWAHPIDGVVAYVDLVTGEVLKLIDDRVFEVPRTPYNFHRADGLPAPRTTQKPIVITQPEGPSFHVDGDVVEWEKWRFRIGFNQVEGLTLHEIGFTDGERHRSIMYRASIAEMVVPYGDPSPVRFWQNYFDAGEYSLGKSANSLALGCDCLGEIHYFDATIAATDGRAQTIRNAICLHEEDASILWKHTDEYYHSTDTRRNRRLVVSFFITVGNYDYGFSWYLYLDGRIELECKATGVVFASAYPGAQPDGSDYPWASQIAPGIGAPYHQHLFSARLDVTLDGTRNAVDELEAQRVPVSAENPHGNGFTLSTRRLRSEKEGVRDADGKRGRVWHVVNPDVTNIVGKPVGYTLRPEGQPSLLADAGSSIARRAAFTTHDLWVTRYSPRERFPSGELVNQNDGYGAIDRWIERDADIDGHDIVLWHTFGLTHFPRTEDWPIMPVDSTGFSLVPHGFFDQNPTLDVPAPAAASACSTSAPACGCGHTKECC